MMATPERYAEAVSVVPVGRFNPAIFQPAWFAGALCQPPWNAT